MKTTFTQKEYKEQKKNNTRLYAQNVNSYRSNKRGNKNIWLLKRYPREIVYALNFDIENVKTLNKIITNFSKGRHILDLSSLDIVNLQKHPNSRKKALINICTLTVASELGISEMDTRKICELSDYVFAQIKEGLKIKIKDLGLNIYLTPDRIINSGNVLKNHNGQAEYGGVTIRDYITYYIKQDKSPELTEEDKQLVSQGISEFKDKLSSEGYNTLKSVPFSVVRMETHLKIDEEGNIASPDIEAKDNIRKIIKPELYNKYPFNKMSAKEATYTELKLFKLIKPVIKQQIKEVLTPVIPMLPNDQITMDIQQAIQLDNISTISKKGRIQDILEFMEKNVKTIASLEQNKETWNRRLTEDEIHSIFQIEYASMPSSDLSDGMAWITDLGLAMKCIYATYPMIKTLIRYKFCPFIEEMPITRYTNDYVLLDKMLQEAVKTEDPQEWFASHYTEYINLAG